MKGGVIVRVYVTWQYSAMKGSVTFHIWRQFIAMKGGVRFYITYLKPIQCDVRWCYTSPRNNTLQWRDVWDFTLHNNTLQWSEVRNFTSHNNALDGGCCVFLHTIIFHCNEAWCKTWDHITNQCTWWRVVWKFTPHYDRRKFSLLSLIGKRLGSSLLYLPDTLSGMGVVFNSANSSQWTCYAMPFDMNARWNIWQRFHKSTTFITPPQSCRQAWIVFQKTSTGPVRHSAMVQKQFGLQVSLSLERWRGPSNCSANPVELVHQAHARCCSAHEHTHPSQHRLHLSKADRSSPLLLPSPDANGPFFDPKCGSSLAWCSPYGHP